MNFARRIVIDTGVLVSAALRPKSVPALALEKAFLHFEICACDETLAELKRVLRRSKFDAYVLRETREEFLAGFHRRVLHIGTIPAISDCPDPEDNKFLALAEAAEAELIVASDSHLTAMHPWRGIPILPPAVFLVR